MGREEDTMELEWEIGFFFFKQKTAYEIYQCDWSSDVCSSDLAALIGHVFRKDKRFANAVAASTTGVRCVVKHVFPKQQACPPTTRRPDAKTLATPIPETVFITRLDQTLDGFILSAWRTESIGTGTSQFGQTWRWNMEKNEFLKQSFNTLRDEIKAIKSRSFWIVAMGLFGVPVITYLAEGAEKFVSLLIPYLVLVLIVMFLAEQNALMRAGRYIRQVIEPNVDKTVGWESWLESRPDLRMMDRHFFACFILVFFVYYFMSVGNAMQTLLGESEQNPSGMWWLIGASVTYGTGAIWALYTLIHRSEERRVGKECRFRWAP